MKDSDTTEYDVFFSHSHEDSPEVEYIARRVEDKTNIRVWLDRWVIVPGDSFIQEMSKGIKEAKCCVVFIGRETPEGWFRQELEHALNRQAIDEGFRLIPVLLPSADYSSINKYLGLRSWVDFKNGLDDEYSLHVLICGIKGVPPGRMPEIKDDDESIKKIKKALARLNLLRSQGFIDQAIHLEYQRKLIDGLIGDIG